MDKQFTEEEAKKIYEDKEWEKWTEEQIVKLQLFQDRLCIPFGVFHKAIESVLDRPVWTHEFAFIDSLRKEYLGLQEAPSFEEILDLIPASKAIVVLHD